MLFAKSIGAEVPPTRTARGARFVATRDRPVRSAIARHPAQRLEPIRFRRRLVAAPAQDPREAHRDAGLVARRSVDRLERELEHLLRSHRADRAEALERIR